MTLTQIRWVGNDSNFLEQNLELIKVCIRRHTSEHSEPFKIAGIYWPLTVIPRRNITFEFNGSQYLAVYENEFVLLFEDIVLNIKYLIEMGDSLPIDIREMDFWSYIAEDTSHLFSL